MSVVTNVILTFSILEDDYEAGDTYGHKCVDKINEWLPCELKNIGGHAGGNKELETDIYIGAFNYLDTEGLKACVFSQEWNEPKDVQLYVQEQQADTFTEYRIEEEL